MKPSMNRRNFFFRVSTMLVASGLLAKHFARIRGDGRRVSHSFEDFELYLLELRRDASDRANEVVKDVVIEFEGCASADETYRQDGDVGSGVSYCRVYADVGGHYLLSEGCSSLSQLQGTNRAGYSTKKGGEK